MARVIAFENSSKSVPYVLSVAGTSELASGLRREQAMVSPSSLIPVKTTFVAAVDFSRVDEFGAPNRRERLLGNAVREAEL
jgi:hypothetical protein